MIAEQTSLVNAFFDFFRCFKKICKNLCKENLLVEVLHNKSYNLRIHYRSVAAFRLYPAFIQQVFQKETDIPLKA